MFCLKYKRENPSHVFDCPLCCMCESFLRSKRWLPSHILRVSKIQDYVKNLVIDSVAALKSLKKHKQVCLYLLENSRKKESMVSKLAHGHVSKFLLVGSNRTLVV